MIMDTRVKQIMKARGMTNKNLADKSGVSLSTIANFAGGVVIPKTAGTLQAIALALNVTVEDLFAPATSNESISPIITIADKFCNEDITKVAEYIKGRVENETFTIGKAKMLEGLLLMCIETLEQKQEILVEQAEQEELTEQEE